jgi:hypothetical protein
VAPTSQSGDWFADMRADGVVHCGGVGETIDEARVRAGLEENSTRDDLGAES